VVARQGPSVVKNSFLSSPFRGISPLQLPPTRLSKILLASSASGLKAAGVLDLTSGDHPLSSGPNFPATRMEAPTNGLVLLKNGGVGAL